MTDIKEYADLIDQADLYEVVEKTPLSKCVNLSKKIKNNVFLKREDLQKVFSFKIRGAFNKISSLTQEERERGLIACSAGNHAQGVALSGQYYGVKTIIVMPLSTPDIKIRQVKNFGGEVVLYGDSFQEAYEHSLVLADKHDYVLIHPYDDLKVIIGQGTIAKEVSEQCDKFDYIFVCIGGGGLAAGVAAYLKERRPSVKIVGVESDESASMYASIKAGEIVSLDWVGSFADGVAVKRVGEHTFEICKDLLDDIVLVSTDEICAAVKDCFEDTRVLMEPSGALSVAGMKKYLKENQIIDKNVIAIASGANVNFDRLRYIAERTQLGEKKEVIIAVELGEKPGELKKFCTTLGKHSITEFNYRYSGDPAQIYVGVQTQDKQDKEDLFLALKKAKLKFVDLTNNELAKVHIRHMVGGRPQFYASEKLFRFEFPERSGALMDFLNHLQSDWNISLFHYRCHGSDKGRVLVGLQIKENDYEALLDAMEKTGYNFWEETENPAYTLFCSGIFR